MELTGAIFDLMGKLMIAFMALKVHHRFLKEHKIDFNVFRAMRREQIIGIIGVIFLVVGFILQLPYKM